MRVVAVFDTDVTKHTDLLSLSLQNGQVSGFVTHSGTFFPALLASKGVNPKTNDSPG